MDVIMDTAETRDEAHRRVANQVRTIRRILADVDRAALEDLYYRIAEQNQPAHGIGLDDIRPILTTLNAEDTLQSHRK